MIVGIQTPLNPLVNTFCGSVVLYTSLVSLDCMIPCSWSSLDNPVPDGLGHDELGVLGAVQLQLPADVSKGDLAVCQRDGLHSSLDDVVVESGDQGVGMVRGELLGGLLENLSKPTKVSRLP